MHNYDIKGETDIPTTKEILKQCIQLKEQRKKKDMRK